MTDLTLLHIKECKDDLLVACHTSCTNTGESERNYCALYSIDFILMYVLHSLKADIMDTFPT